MVSSHLQAKVRPLRPQVQVGTDADCSTRSKFFSHNTALSGHYHAHHMAIHFKPVFDGLLLFNFILSSLYSLSLHDQEI